MESSRSSPHRPETGGAHAPTGEGVCVKCGEPDGRTRSGLSRFCAACAPMLYKVYRPGD